MVVYTKPLDGGWAWVIALCGMYHHMCTTGLALSMGVLYVSWLDQFGAGKGSTSWIISICVATTFGLCPIAANLASRYGFRFVGFLGGILTCTGLAISVFATSVTYLIISIGLVAGLGNCFCYLPGVTIVTMYFEEHRSFAMAITTSGNGLGAFMFAPFINYLEEIYGWRGAVLICSGICLNMCVTSLLFRPMLIGNNLETSMNRDKEETTPLQTKSSSQVSNTNFEVSYNGEMDMKRYVLSISEFQSDVYSHSGYIDCSNELSKNNLPDHQTDSVAVAFLGESPRGLASESLYSLPVIHEKICLEVQAAGEGKRMISSLNELTFKELPTRHHHSFKSLQNIDISILASLRHIHQIPVKEEKSSLMRTDSRSCKQYDNSDEPKQTCFISKCLLRPIFKSNIDMLRDKAFLALAFSNFFTNLTFITPVVYLVDRAVHEGIDKATAAILISANGIGSFCGRIFFGWLLERCCSNRLLVYILCISACGGVTILSSLCADIVFLHVAYAASFGCLIGVYTILAPLVTVDLMGVSRVVESYGLLLAFMGPATVIGPPLAGWLYDWSRSYVLSYVVNGVFLLASGLMLVPLLCTTEGK